ncbi:MAG: hypothetical protein H0W83_10390 [Planctomycetes bacterium]|nr:hypothetical protein [Planctomycetota bacterium]
MTAAPGLTYVCHSCHASMVNTELRSKRNGSMLVLSLLCVGAGVGAAVYHFYPAAAGLAVVALVFLAIGLRSRPACVKCGSTKLAQADSAPLTTKYFKKQMQKQQEQADKPPA